MISKKLLEFQKLGITLKKDKENPFFKSNYSSLNEVLEKVEEKLNEVGIVIVSEPTIGGLRTRLVDTEDDTEIFGIMPWVGCDTAQKILASTTYYRRGTLVALLNLESEDDDGNEAVGQKIKTTNRDF